jgi:hypothetical protein
MKTVSLLICAAIWCNISVSYAENAQHKLNPEWTVPLKVGDMVPQVMFQTRIRIESDDENPFDWKGMYKYL